MQTKLEKPEEKEIICRKCNAVYIFWGIVFFVILLMMFMCLFLDFGTVGKSSVLQFFFLAELVVAIVVFEEYMDILIIGKNGIRFESGILVKNKKEIPYDKINSINIHSAFGFGTLEILTGNDIMTRYRFLHEYDKVEKLIKSRINSEK